MTQNLRCAAWTLTLAGLVTASVWTASALGAEAVSLKEQDADQRAFQNAIKVSTTGKVSTAKVGGSVQELDLQGQAEFQFLSRRLPSAGRDAAALREFRHFTKGELQTAIGDHRTQVSLSSDRSVIVTNATREGLISYTPQSHLTRDLADLLDIPGDSLTLSALLPPTPQEPGQEWKPADWAMQLLAGIEAVESSTLTCKLEQATPTAAKVTFQGSIKGQRLGTNTALAVRGAFLFDREQQFISQSKAVFSITADIGVVNPGLNMTATTTCSRTLAENPGPLTDEQLAGIPLSPEPDRLQLAFEAAPWGLRVLHHRDWHLFHSVLEGANPVAILRLVDLGSLIAQCNLSPIAPAAAGQTIPLSQFEADIQQSLGKRFGGIVSREQIPADDGRQIFRVVANGTVQLTGKDSTAELPMMWIYYLVAHRDGRQASFVFSVEPALLEKLNDRDREIVEKLEFASARR